MMTTIMILRRILMLWEIWKYRLVNYINIYVHDLVCTTIFHKRSESSLKVIVVINSKFKSVAP